ncbi:MSC_0619 family F1-like ATPase alpha subunit [Mesomycoplasma molare]|uniref:ATP F0F1 synthase subunit alpha n=1 Tax=Mesomycoplasma molare TaxID=171288 RepID=A0ABY5TYC0_9BACT|nr:ATP F0F1 synthase subunit alpha [Mesomycoplasma molare]UWD34521.1 ATP F0F1 synthase subunit alpha [Mesomycoplasma molare]
MKKNNPIIKSINNSLIEVEGEFDYAQNQFFKINNDTNAFLLDASNKKANLIISNTNSKININTEIETYSFESIETKESYFGNIIDINGNLLNKEEIKFDSKEDFSYGQSKIFSTARDIKFREKLNTPLKTGYFGIDLFTPIGRGQRQLIIGDRKTGKTFISLSSLINNKNEENVKFIYASIGQKQNSVSEVFSILKKNNCLSKTIIIHASPDNSYEQFLLPYVAMAHAENLEKNNFDVVLVLDDLSKHANIYREISLLINKPVGREAFPGDIFFMHSKLLERGGNFKNSGSITVLPIIETNSGDITSLIASNLISITDGQIITNAELFNLGIIPAINFSISVSRTGASVQDSRTSKISKEIYKIYNTYLKNKNLTDLNFNISKTFSKILNQGKNIEKFLIQKDFDSLYKNSELILISQIIKWDILNWSDENKELINFIFRWFKTNWLSKSFLDNYMKCEYVDEYIWKEYVIHLFNSYYEFKNINRKLKNELFFRKISKEMIKKVLGE